jgi:methylated-DNA-[protein]-cysteine S-methyltransferase
MDGVDQTIRIESPVGPLSLTAAEGRITRIAFAGRADGLAALAPAPGGEAGSRSSVLARAAEQLAEYFDGTRTSFDLPLGMPREGLNGRVLAELARVPYGGTVTYKELALRCGLDATRVRDVGGVMARNPLVIVVPCHRVIGSDGSLVGFGGGLASKRALLDLEAPQLQLA